MKTSQGQAIIQEACGEVKQLMLIQMVEEQRQMLSQAKKEVKSCPLEMIKSLRKEVRSLRAQLLKLQTPVNTQNSTAEDSSENQAQVKQTEPEDTCEPNSTEN